MALRTAGVGAERKLQIWDQYGVKKYEFLPTEMTTPGVVTYEFEHLLGVDVTLSDFLKVSGQADFLDTVYLHGQDLLDIALVMAKDKGFFKANALDNYLQFSGDNHAYPSRIVLAGRDAEFLDDVSHPEWEGAILFQTGNAADNALANRLIIKGKADVVDAVWATVLQSGLKLKDALDANGQKITGLGAPTLADEALRKGEGELVEGDVDVTSIEVLSHKNVASGYCPLDAGVLVPLANIPDTLTGKDADTVDSVEGADIIQRDGSVDFTGDQSMGSHKLTNLAAPVAANDAARKADVVAGGGGVFGAPSDKTIAIGAITPDTHFHNVETEGGVPSDDLITLTIAGAVGAGWMVVLKAKDTTHTVVCKHVGGNLRLDGQTDFSLDNIDDSITLICDGTNWLEISRSNNGAA